MNFHEYQVQASKFAKYPNIGNNITYPVLGLAGETGEVAEKIKKIYRDKNGIVSDEDKISIAKELGDVLWYISAICGELGIELEDVAWHNVQKLTKRLETNTIHGSGDNREEDFPKNYFSGVGVKEYPKKQCGCGNGITGDCECNKN